MKKAGKRILALGVTLGIICGIGGTAFAAEKLTVTINGSKATCLSTINASDTASAYTTYNGNGAVSVKATYTTKNLPTGEVHKTTRTKATYGTASVTITKIQSTNVQVQTVDKSVLGRGKKKVHIRAYEEY